MFDPFLRPGPALDPNTLAEMTRTALNALSHAPLASAEAKLQRCQAVIAAIGALQPRDPIEAHLAARALTAHYAAMEHFRCAAQPDLPPGLQLRFAARAIQLCRLMDSTTDTLARRQCQPALPATLSVARVGAAASAGATPAQPAAEPPSQPAPPPPMTDAPLPPAAGAASLQPAAGAALPPAAGPSLPPVAGPSLPPMAGSSLPPMAGTSPPPAAGAASAPPAAGAQTPPVRAAQQPAPKPRQTQRHDAAAADRSPRPAAPALPPLAAKRGPLTTAEAARERMLEEIVARTLPVAPKQALPRAA
jgi:hypothetical protein